VITPRPNVKAILTLTWLSTILTLATKVIALTRDGKEYLLVATRQKILGVRSEPLVAQRTSRARPCTIACYYRTVYLHALAHLLLVRPMEKVENASHITIP